ncbi:hypothetical protein Dsin_030321 [Dipteronia sinensis]|uniref:Uncharacterized protein n=1 Tax=Dipteronia sinensis TaxID=43782 RepID=A0AAE0DSB9_9ROSI|nr:hypothetical protein Dsin_030321 [Dipteronia sinensis]
MVQRCTTSGTAILPNLSSITLSKILKVYHQKTKKRASGPKCPVTGKRIQGIPQLRPALYKRTKLSRNGGLWPVLMVEYCMEELFWRESKRVVRRC